MRASGRPAERDRACAWLSGRRERSLSGCHKCSTPVAKRPSLRRTPVRMSRTNRSESSRPQPVKARVEAVDPLKIVAKERHVAAAGALPTPPAELAQGTERQRDQGRDAVDDRRASVAPAAVASRQVSGSRPSARMRSRQCGRQQHPVAGDETARLGEPAVGRDEIRPRDAVAVEEDAVAAGARRGSRGCGSRRARKPRSSCQTCRSGARACAPSRSSTTRAVAGREPSSATMISKSRSVCRDSERSTASSASSRL